jgi:hypothetical protein
MGKSILGNLPLPQVPLPQESVRQPDRRGTELRYVSAGAGGVQSDEGPSVRAFMRTW